MFDVVGYVNIMERGGKRWINLNIYYEKFSDLDSCEIEKCIMRNY